MNDRNAWDTLDTESSAAYEAFSAYLSLPRKDRSLLAAYRLQNGCAEARTVPGQWNAWSRAHRWVERARAWDTHKAKAEREARLETDLKNLDNLDKLATGMMGKAAAALQKMKAERVSPHAVAQMAKTASEIIHAARVARAEIQETQTETLPTDGYDVLDSLRAHPDLAPVIVHLQGLGVDLESDPGEHGGDAERGQVDA